MIVLYTILLVLASICFLLTVFNKPVRNLNLLALGLAFWVLVPTLQTLTRAV